MGQYILKSALVTWINEKKIPFKKDIDDGVYPTYLCALMDFEDFLDTLEVKEKEVDLEKEIKRFTMSKELYEADSVIKAVAEHFFELGLKTKGE